jgi:hypothetical protein
MELYRLLASREVKLHLERKHQRLEEDRTRSIRHRCNAKVVSDKSQQLWENLRACATKQKREELLNTRFSPAEFGKTSKNETEDLLAARRSY